MKLYKLFTLVIGLIVIMTTLPASAVPNSDELFYSDFGGWEMDTIVETTTIKGADGVFHRWYRAGDDTPDCAIGYASSTDGVTFTRYEGNPLKFVDGKGDRFPVVVDHNGKYYMFIKEKAHGFYYLYDVTDPISPVILNGGNPVITTDLYNIGVTVVNNRFHVLAEAPTAGFGLRYTYADINTLDFDAHLSGIIINNGGNAWLKYIPERNAILAVYGLFSNSWWKVVSSYAYLTDDLSLSSSWHASTALGISQTNIHIADPDLFVTGIAGSKNLIIGASYAQRTHFQWNSSLTLLQFFDNVVSNTPITMTPDVKNPTMDTDNEKWSYNTSRLMDNGKLTLSSETSPVVTRYNTFSDNSGYTVKFNAQKVDALSRITFITRYIDDYNYARFWFEPNSTNIYYQEKINGIFGPPITLEGANPFTDLLTHSVKVVVSPNGDNALYVDGKIYGSKISSLKFIGQYFRIGFTAYIYNSIYSEVVVTRNATPGTGNTLLNYPTLLNGVLNFDTSNFDAVAYYKDSQGLVHLEGFAKNVVNGTVVFNLPEGFRPNKKKRFSTVGNDSFAVLQVSDTGDVSLMAGSGTSTLSLNVPPFRAEK